jgi:hypothetical protein
MEFEPSRCFRQSPHSYSRVVDKKRVQQETKHSDGALLGSLKSSIVLMRAINRNASSDSILVIFENDFQLVAMLESYLLHNGCIEQDLASKSGWIVTSIGQGWIDRHSEILTA